MRLGVACFVHTLPDMKIGQLKFSLGSIHVWVEYSLGLEISIPKGSKAIKEVIIIHWN